MDEEGLDFEGQHDLDKMTAAEFLADAYERTVAYAASGEGLIGAMDICFADRTGTLRNFTMIEESQIGAFMQLLREEAGVEEPEAEVLH